MKKILLFASALAGLFLAASCQQENLEPVGGNTVTYTVQVPDALATKALGDDITNVNVLHYEVYRTEVANTETFTEGVDNLLYHKTASMTNGVATISLELVNDQNYTVLFWAQVGETNEAYEVSDLTNVTVKSSLNANQVDYAAFAGVDFIVEGKNLAGRTVTLERPISQINIATTSASLGGNGAFQEAVVLEGSSVTVVGLSRSFNVAKQEPAAAMEAVYEFAEQAVPVETLDVNGVGYTYVAMNYVGFADEVGNNVKVSYVINTTEGDIDNDIENVPVKPNYRTNIVGNLITATSDYTVTLDAEWDGVADEVEVWDGKFITKPAYNDDTKTWSVGKASELAWLAAAVNGTIETKATEAPKTFSDETFVLTADIDLGNFPWTPIGLTGDQAGFQGVFDGNGKTISNLYVDLTAEPKYQSAGLFGSLSGTVKDLKIVKATVKNLDKGADTSNGTAVVVGASQNDGNILNVTVKDAVVEGNRRVAGIAGYFKGTINNCSVENIKLTATPDDLDNDGVFDNGDKVGGIVGYTNSSATITECSVTNISIKGYRDLGGLVGGGYTVGNYTNNEVNNGSIVVDQSVMPYFEAPKAANANPIVGRILSGTLPASNTSSDVAVVNTDDAVGEPDTFADALANVADGGVVAVSGEISTTSLNASGKNITIVGTTEDATIDASSQSNYIDASGVTFKNLTVKVASTKDNFHKTGFINGSTVFENCKFEGTVTAQIGEYVFNNCVFTNTTEGHYPAFVYAGKATYNNCTFEGVDRAAKVYNHGDTYDCAAVYNNCTFKATKVYKTAVEIDATYNVSGTPYLVEINNPTLVNMGEAEHYAIGDGVCNLETSGKGLGIVNLNGKGYSVAHKASQISALADAGKSVTIEVAADITENVSFTQEKDLDIVLDGKGKEMNGTINITARAGKDAAGSLVIKDFNFKTAATTHNFIYSSENNYYPNNVTVSGCTFEGPGADSNVVPVTLKSSSNFVMENCTATGVHSLIQNTSGWNLTIRNCEVTNAGRGISLGSCQGVLVENVKIQASNEKYGIRADGAYANTTTIKNCEISSFIPVVVRNASAAYKLVFDGTNTMTAANTDGLWCAIGTSEYEANGSMPSAATGSVIVTLNDAGLDAAGVYGASNL